jgi:hypothetical protein
VEWAFPETYEDQLREQAFTGMKACLLGDGRSFEMIADQRLPGLQNTNPSSAPAQPVENRAQE